MNLNIQKINSSNVHSLEEFFQNCNTSTRHRDESFEEILEQLKMENNFYNVYANFKNEKIVSAVMMMTEVPIQKVQILDLYFTRKGFDLTQTNLGELVDYAIKQGEQKGICRVMSMVTESYYRKLRALEKANKIFTWKTRYDCVIDEVLEPDHFSKYGIIYDYITKRSLRKDRIFITHYLMKPEYIKQYYDSLSP